MSDVINVDELKNNISTFAKERDWEQFHTPKKLACALSVEASELLEIFQWMSESEQKNISSEIFLKAPMLQHLKHKPSFLACGTAPNHTP